MNSILPPSPSLPLDQCRKNTLLRIIELAPQPLFGAQDERVTLRLRELGFVPGTIVKIIGVGFLGRDPLAILVNGTKFALRRAEAAKVRVEEVTPAYESADAGVVVAETVEKMQ